MSMMQMDDYRTKATQETFGFLPEFSADEIYDQSYTSSTKAGLPALEHEAPEQASHHYWGMWKLPFFGMRDPNEVIREIEACRAAYPNHFVRLIGYDNYTQCQGHNFVVYRPRGL